MVGARPSSLLLRNRTVRSTAAAESDGLLELFSRSGRRALLPLPSALDDDSRALRGGESQPESTPVGSSELTQSGAEDPLSGASSDVEKRDLDCLLSAVEHSAAMSEYVAFKWKCCLDECAHQKHADEWHLSQPGTTENSSLGAQNAQLGEQDNSSSMPVTASISSQNMPHCESGQPTRTMRSSSSRSSLASTPSSNISNNPNKASFQSTGLVAGTSRRPSTPNKSSPPARPSTPNRLSTPARPSTPCRPSNKPSTAARPSTPNKSSAAARPSTPNKPLATARPSTPNKPSAAARPSTPNKPSAAARPSTPSRASAPIRPSAADRPSTPSRPSATARPSTPDRISAPTRPSTPSVPGMPSVPTRPSTPNRQVTSASAQAAVPTRQSTPNKRGTSTSTLTASTTHPVISGPSNPEKSHLLYSSGEKTPPAHVLKSSIPSSHPQISATSHSNSRSTSTATHPQIPAGSNSVTSRTTSRASTPTRRTPVSAPVAPRSNSAGRFPASRAKNSGPLSRPSSPSPQNKTSVQPIIPPDFSLDVPPNLRTKLPDRPASAGRTRPGAKLSGRANLDTEPSQTTNPTRRQSPLQVTSRGRVRDNSPKARILSDGYGVPIQKTERDGPTKKTSKTPISIESNGLGHTLTKKSLEMALKHMDIRQGAGGIRGMSLFPHSIRTASTKASPGRSSGILTPTSSNETDTEDNSWNGTTSGSASINDGVSENGDIVASFPHGAVLVARVTEPDPYENYGYDTMLLKEDTKDMNWLHNDDDNTNLLDGDTKDTEWLRSAENTIQSPVFEQQYELLPEPFGLM